MLPRRIMAVVAPSRHTKSAVRYLQLSELVVSPPSWKTASRRCFSSRSDNAETHEEQYDASGDDQQQQQQHHHYQQSGNEMGMTDAPSRQPPSPNKKWQAPFWLPPPSSSSKSSSSSRRTNKNHHKNNARNRPQRRPRFETRNVNRYRDASLPCRQHLDLYHKKSKKNNNSSSSSIQFPTSDWVHIFGALPMTSLEEVLDSIETILKEEAFKSEGIVDLDAEWNPHRDGEDLPLVPSILEVPVQDPATEKRREYALDKDMFGDSSHANGNSIDNDNDNDSHSNEDATIEMESFRVVKAHVVLSPFGRPTGWNLKLANPSMVHALLSHAHNARVRGSIRIGWKFAKVQEYHPPPPRSTNNTNTTRPQYDPKDTRTMLVVSDSMVRFENCPSAMTEDHLRHMLSRYELTPKGSTIVKWKGRTSDGRIPPLTFVVRFASPAYARAAVRELQGKPIQGRPMKLIQYPKQLL